ncbi:MAG: hypothetical protein QM784_30430 [Polyangiaceae bacterium]
MRRICAVLRVVTLALVMLGLVTALNLRQAEARFGEVLGGFGHTLSQLDRFRAHSGPRKLFVNGLEFRIESLSTSLPLTEALNRFGSLCHAASDVELPAQVRKKLASSSSGPSSGDMPATVREESETEGYLGCLDVGAGQTGEGLLTRLIELSRTRNLRSLGSLRYAMARRHRKTTTLVVLWTEGDLVLTDLFPKDRDAPGGDLKGVPRPKGTTRVLSAFEEALPYGFVAYRLAGTSRSAATASYAALLEREGWRVERAKTGVMPAEKGGRRVLVQASQTGATSVILTLSDLG